MEEEAYSRLGASLNDAFLQTPTSRAKTAVADKFKGVGWYRRDREHTKQGHIYSLELFVN
jgi:predicted nucleic acid-binding Zn ribbon protein